MCGGAIISEFIPQRDARGRAGKRGLCAEDLWPQPGAGFDDVPAADGYELTGAASFPHDQGNNVVYFLVPSAHSKHHPYVPDAVPVMAAPPEDAVAYVHHHQLQQDAGMEMWTFDGINTAVPL
ncbi:hypothetical protein C2845_PM04G33380 [Panicum miliaceum]|uniref:Uncharacterized protein n=1 Tax=Panicum miliaceum TaxID=4540 RepID=A0A3L6QT76_PANMI|nr:hypothetical protein C2845_PM04G33380 [Panicum miliaceum]